MKSSDDWLIIRFANKTCFSHHFVDGLANNYSHLNKRFLFRFKLTNELQLKSVGNVSWDDNAAKNEVSASGKPEDEEDHGENDEVNEASMYDCMME